MSPLEDAKSNGETTARTAAAPAAAPQPQPFAQPQPAPVPYRPEPKRKGPIRRLFRWIVSHTVVAAIAVAGVFYYLHQDMILGRMADSMCGKDALGPWIGALPKPGSAPSTAAATPPQSTPAASSAKPAATATPSPAPTVTKAEDKPAEPPKPAPAPASDVPAASPPATKSAEPPKAATAEPAPKPAVAPPSATPSPAASVALATPPAPAQAAQSSATQSPAAAPAPAPTALSSPTPEAKPSAEALTRSWRAAREAFAAGKPEAVDTYKALLKSYPDIPDLAGELGNVYYAGGKWREAGEQYYEAAQRYLRSPQPGYAACLLDVLRQMRAPEAEKLARDVKAPCPAASQTAGAQSGAAPQR